MKQLDILKTENEIERSHYPILLQAQKAWENIEHFRQKRKRNRDYTYGKQWNDLIKLPDGRVVSEEQYIREQGKVPLKNNLIRQMVKAVLGQFRNNQTQPVCIARDRQEQSLGELMSTAVQYAYQHNRLQELDSRTLEEFLISGICFQKIGYGHRRGKTDVWVDEINPNRIFFNAMEDSRSNPSLSNSDILVNLEVPEGVNPDELNKYELMFYGFQRRTAMNYINSFFKHLDKFQRENPHKNFPMTDSKQVMTGRLTYDEKGNIKQIKMIRWTNVDQLQGFFENVLKDMDTLHNPPTALWEKSGEFSIFFSLVING
jgi:hypothetical protein